MSPEDLKQQKEVEFYATSVTAWYNTALERDRGLFTLSAGGHRSTSNAAYNGRLKGSRTGRFVRVHNIGFSDQCWRNDFTQYARLPRSRIKRATLVPNKRGPLSP